MAAPERSGGDVMTAPTTFAAAAALLRVARTPKEVFGADPRGAAAIYRALAKLVHPDRVGPDQAAAAHAAFAALGTLWAARGGQVISAGGRDYRVGERVGGDELADYLDGEVDGKPVLLKVTRRPADNDLTRREVRALELLDEEVEPRHRAYLPRLRAAFTHRDRDTGADRVVTVFAPVDGFVSLAAVRAAHPGGLDARDVAWMWRRLLVAIGVAHRAGVVHGAVLPDRVLIEPAQHGLMLVGWGYAAVPPEHRVPALVERYRDWYPPEVPAKQQATAATDIYLATRCVVELMGHRAPEPLRRFARGCLLRPPAARPQDAWQLLAELDERLEQIYGPRRFRPFALPATVPAWPR
ncbi:hypothetical protein GCM10009682_15470 [Luedemannella flava]|uniref:Protein kinase domain-containing protein n=2 Tax=Luedemannella flava TaxID=349316 RepID=A0ABN2LQ49_9ACTN